MKLLPRVLAFLLLFALYSCSSSHQLVDDSTFLVQKIAVDPSYGYTESNPIKVGGNSGEGPKNEHRFLNALAGPNGEKITYERLGSCCPFETGKLFLGLRLRTGGPGSGIGMLDRYKVQWSGQAEPLVLYMNMYDTEELQIPVGMAVRR